MHEKEPNKTQWQILFLSISAQVRSIGATKFGINDVKVAVHAWQSP